MGILSKWLMVKQGSAFSPFMHDSMYLYALGLNRTLAEAKRRQRTKRDSNESASMAIANDEDKPPWRQGRQILKNCANLRFKGDQFPTKLGQQESFFDYLVYDLRRRPKWSTGY